MKFILPAFFALLSIAAAESGAPVQKFQQLDSPVPTPSAQRLASGAPGKDYWQNRADYDINVELDDVKRTITAEATVTYHNASPDALEYLWVQLDQNYLSHNADSRAAPNTKRGIDPNKITYSAVDRLLAYEDYDGEMKINKLADAQDKPLPHALVKTMLRIDLPQPLAAGADFVFKIGWSYPINDCDRINARTGYEFFKEDGNCIYTIAQWFPRMAAYTDYAGWINKQFLGTGEFTLEFGDYTVRLTVPDDHLVAATGVLQNAEAVLTETQRERLRKAQGETKKPVFIVTPDEAKAAEKGKPKGKKTWEFKAVNVRDFAFASSRKFIWDAMAVEGATHPPTPERQGGIADRMYRPPVMAMSLYPKEGMPLWDKYSTHAIAHTIQVYSRYTFEYPYPVAWSVNGPVGGMEYPMICFNGPRPEKDGTYPERTKYALIGVVIHEVGHNWFPMIVNSDERQWTWMDEGLNSFVEYLAEEEWENDWKHRRNERGMVDYMRTTDRVPVMTNSESIADLGPNAYGQPTVALNILREHILGREAFDHAFKTYAKRWMFKRPTPSDFFRTMEDASGIDLDWFWRGWFFSVDHVDVAVDEVKWLQLDSRDPAIEKKKKKQQEDELPKTTTKERNYPLSKRVDRFPELKDFYDSFDETTVLPSEKKKFESLIKELNEEEIDPKLLETKHNFYAIELRNVGGLVTPVILKIEYTDGSTEEMKLPAEIWRFNTQKASKLLFTKKELKSVTFDPRQELVDTDVENNFWPRRPVKSKFQLFKEDKAPNPMRELTKPEKKEEETKADEKK
ncbi:MAG: M1 family metallopeptidase [Verrucomicrobiaceae bacterium]|nr:M1 family metallopeptidase [Verrucomicrobiaceae bacterium]